MIQRLSSVKFAFYNLVILILLMSTGVFISQTFKNEVTLMNEVRIFDWLAPAFGSAPILVVWFLLLCTSAASLLLNALCCTLAQQLVLAKKSGVLKYWLFFILHSLFIIVLVCHGLILVSGEKKSNVILVPGQTRDFGHYKIQVSDIVFTNDVKILKAPKKKRRAMMTRKNIQIDKNYVAVTLLKGNVSLVSKKVMMLSPLRYKSYQVTLIEFVIMEGDDRLGVNLTLTKNILNGFFFSVYGVMILALAGFTAVTWKKSEFEKEK